MRVTRVYSSIFKLIYASLNKETFKALKQLKKTKTKKQSSVYSPLILRIVYFLEISGKEHFKLLYIQKNTVLLQSPEAPLMAIKKAILFQAKTFLHNSPTTKLPPSTAHTLTSRTCQKIKRVTHHPFIQNTLQAMLMCACSHHEQMHRSSVS